MNAERLLAHYEQIADAPDAIGRLRRFILDLAVRGKLVPQDPKDEPAAELLERIAIEKATLAKAGKLKKTDIEPATRDADAPFELPASWAWACLGDVAQYGSSAKVDSNKDISDGTWVLDLEDIEKDTSRLIERVLSSARSFQSTKTVFKRGDVLFGKLRPYLNKTLVADQDGVCTSEIIPIRGYCRLAPEYVRLVLKSPLTMMRVDRLMYGMKMPRLGTGDAVTLGFPLPPLAEQHRIVAQVDELMALCDRLEAARAEREATRHRLGTSSLARLNAPDPATFHDDARFVLNALPALTTRPDQIKQLRQTILNLAVRGKLVPQDPEDEPAADWLGHTFQGEVAGPGKKSKSMAGRPLEGVEAGYSLPPSWLWIELGNLVTVMDAGWSPQCESHPRTDPKRWGVLKTTAVQTLAFDCRQHKELPKKFEPRPQHEANVGDILVTRAGPKNRVGISCAVDKTEPRLMISDKLIRFRLAVGLSPRFFALTLNAGISSEAIEAAKSGMAVMQMNISQDKLRAVPVPLPPLTEQHRIVAKVDELMALCDQLEASLIDTAATRRRLLDALLAEALEPAEAREVESVA